MSGTATYHEVPQSHRIQKRLVLNQCFRRILEGMENVPTLSYVTFGGEELCDVLDLVAVFDIRKCNLNVVSYEEDEEAANRSRVCPIATTLSKVATVSITIVPTLFFEHRSPLDRVRPNGPIVYFLDDTKVFGEPQADTFLELVRAKLLFPGDWLLVTSCLTPRVVRQQRFMSRYHRSFQMYYQLDEPADLEFRIRNHVDLLVNERLNRANRLVDQKMQTSIQGKFRYRDTKAEMGLWLFEICPESWQSTKLADCEFEKFPTAFEYVEDVVPDIFEDMD